VAPAEQQHGENGRTSKLLGWKMRTAPKSADLFLMMLARYVNRAIFINKCTSNFNFEIYSGLMNKYCNRRLVDLK